MGGTGLYLRAVVDDLRFPGRYPAVREALEAELGEGRAEVPELHARLAVLDPVAAARMEPTNQRRVVRALEVTLGSGQPFSTFGPGLEAYPPSPVAMVGLAVPTEEVDRRIAERFARWIEEGLLDEVRALAARPGGISRTARQALGYRELLAPRGAGCAPGRLRGGSGAPDPDLRPPPGVVVPARPPDRVDRGEGRTPPICSTGPWAAHASRS